LRIVARRGARPPAAGRARDRHAADGGSRPPEPVRHARAEDGRPRRPRPVRGTGALALEALSRGAAARRAGRERRAGLRRDLPQSFGPEVRRPLPGGTGRKYRRRSSSFAASGSILVFSDPPYASRAAQPTLEALASHDLLGAWRAGGAGNRPPRAGSDAAFGPDSRRRAALRRHPGVGLLSGIAAGRCGNVLWFRAANAVPSRPIPTSGAPRSTVPQTVRHQRGSRSRNAIAFPSGSAEEIAARREPRGSRTLDGLTGAITAAPAPDGHAARRLRGNADASTGQRPGVRDVGFPPGDGERCGARVPSAASHRAVAFRFAVDLPDDQRRAARVHPLRRTSGCPRRR